MLLFIIFFATGRPNSAYPYSQNSETSEQHNATDLIFSPEDISVPMSDQPRLGHSGEGSYHQILLPWALHTIPGQWNFLRSGWSWKALFAGCWWPLVWNGTEHHLQGSGSLRYIQIHEPDPDQFLSGWRSCECHSAQWICLEPSHQSLHSRIFFQSYKWWEDPICWRW